MRTPLTYCDPPYAASSRLEPAKGYRHDDDGDLWERLVAVLADVRHAAVILSGYPCADAQRLGWRALALQRKRTVQARAGATLTASPETVWLSPNIAERELRFAFDGELTAGEQPVAKPSHAGVEPAERRNRCTTT